MLKEFRGQIVAARMVDVSLTKVAEMLVSSRGTISKTVSAYIKTEKTSLIGEAEA